MTASKIECDIEQIRMTNLMLAYSKYLGILEMGGLVGSDIEMIASRWIRGEIKLEANFAKGMGLKW